MDIKEIKAQLSIEQVLRHYGDEVKGTAMRCPFHEDKSASMKVYFDTNVVRCFSGNCQHSGKTIDQIDYIMYRDNLNKHEAILEAGRRAGLEPIQKQVYIKTSKVNTVLTLEDVFKYMQNGFSRTRSAQEYAAKRGLDFLNLEIGYSSGQMHYKKESQYLSDLEALQIIKPLSSSGYITFAKNGIIFPLKDSAGQVCSLYGRKIDGKGHYYLTGRCGLYPGYPPSETKKVLLVESVIDAATLLQVKELSDYFILALYGTNGLTAEHKTALQALPNLEEVVLMLDGDEAGRKAASQYQSELTQLFLSNERKNIQIKKVDLPQDADVNELWVNHQEPQLFLDFLQSPINTESEEKKPISSPLEDDEEPESRLKIINSTFLLWESKALKIEVLGGVDLGVMESLRATLRITREPKRNALDTLRQSLDLYHNNQLNSLLKKLHEQLELPMQDLRLELAEFIEALEQYRNRERQKTVGKSINKRVLSKEREKAARAFLMDKKLMQKTLESLGKVGVVGEQENAFTMFLCFSSRKLDKPLHVISLGSSGSGKTHLQEVIASLMPEEEVLSVTSLSDNALYYYEENTLKHSLFLVEDMDGLSEDALYAIRELMSKGFIIKNVPVKEGANGKLKTVKVLVNGPICFAGCTTREKLYEDNANRSLLLYRDESGEHRAAVMAAQRKAAAGKVNEAAQVRLKELFKDCQMLLKSIKVVNPYAEQLVLPEKVFKPLRTNAHYLKFIEVVTFYHQLQREQKRDGMGQAYIETTLEDIEWANKLMKDILLAKSDELSWNLRQFLERLKNWLKDNEKESFGAMELRTAFRMPPATVKKYLYELRQYGLLKVLGGSKYRGFEYALLNEIEYEELGNNLQSALDLSLQEIKNQLDKDKNNKK
jgi:DNA primase